MTIKVVAFALDNTIWSGKLDEKKFGKGKGASSKIEDNLELAGDRRIRDKSNHDCYVTLHSDVPGIVHDILKRGIKLAIVSSNSSENLTNRALYYLHANDEHGHSKSIISLVKYNEIGKSDGKIGSLKRIKEWSGASYNEIVFFDSDSSSKDVNSKLGVKFEHIQPDKGVKWDVYKHAVGNSHHGHHGDPYDTPFYGKPKLGKELGAGKFAKVYESPDDSHVVIKVLKNWTKDMRHRFLEIYGIIKHGKPFHPGNNNNDQYLLMLALELRNLAAVDQLKAPKPAEHFSGWFTITKAQGVPIWKTPLYKKHPFSVPFQRLIKTAFHLAIDEIERTVKKHGIEHRDAHLANVYFDTHGDQPTKAHLLDWGIAVKMKWDGSRYVRGQDHLVWQDAGAGEKYTPEEFRRYWIKWMVKTEYEANMKRHSITDKDGKEFLKDIDWWYHR